MQKVDVDLYSVFMDRILYLLQVTPLRCSLQHQKGANMFGFTRRLVFFLPFSYSRTGKSIILWLACRMRTHIWWHCLNFLIWYAIAFWWHCNTHWNFLYVTQADCELIKIDVNCHIQGDVVLECITLDADQEREEMMFRVMFNTAFIRSNILMLNRDEIDMMWDTKDRFPKEFRAEVCICCRDFFLLKLFRNY